MVLMKVVGVRELKNRLSQYLQTARKGEYVWVTDRGQVVAEIRQANSVTLADRVPPGLAALVSRGIVSVGTENDASVYPRMKRIPGVPSALKLLEEERKEG
jgi:antitoxin (DNA-binding transcriptional repressor) of toxin-antitoxin stability system